MYRRANANTYVRFVSIPVIENSEPNFRKSVFTQPGSEADIRSSRLNYASAPTDDISLALKQPSPILPYRQGSGWLTLNPHDSSWP